MPYLLKLYIYMGVVWTLAIVVYMRWLNPYGLLANLLFRGDFQLRGDPLRSVAVREKSLAKLSQ